MPDPPTPDALSGPSIVHTDAPPSARDIRDSVVTKAGELFLLTNLEGNVPPGNRNGFGLYHGDTRMLSGFELVVQNLRPTILLSTGHAHFLSEQVLTNPNLVSADGQEVHEQTMEIRRYRRLVGGGVREQLAFENFNQFPVKLIVSIRLEADFADMFEVRGLVERDPAPERHHLTCRENTLCFSYETRDGTNLETRVAFEPAPDKVKDSCVIYALELPARGSKRLMIRVDLKVPSNGAARARPAPPSREPVAVHTSDGLFDQILRQARTDLNALMTGADGERFPAAGVPWYAGLFGRDSLITALCDLWLDPTLARDTLRLLAHHQGERDEPWRDEEPGKILHELRRGELARAGRIPYAPYFGTVDATPLWVMVLADYHRVTGDLELVRELRPNLDRALRWCDHAGDLDGDGFVEYRRRSASGLVNQGWKDSFDGIVHADGSFPEAPIALVEAQAYVYAAKRGAAELYRALGDAMHAARLEREAEKLRDAFDAAFWWEEEGFYVLGLDAQKKPMRVVTSNPGHALLCGIVPAERAALVAKRLVEEDLFSGWGLRTLSARAKSYNPAGYHLGTVWPHDNALAALGLKRYGEDALALEIADAVLEAAHHFPSFRLPEVFCGFARSAFGTPVRYPVACSPQAWAAAAPSAFLQVMLGIRPCGFAREVRIVRPHLPAWMHWARLERLRVGDGEVDLRYERVGDHTAVDVMAMRGDVRVTFVDRWAE